ncbi:signal peptidase I [Rhodobacter veldkampii DSM 11550]|uniref:Signal peptidase I n=1 Tax=Phaeovulum veldkampii DSM 11550 TaxID=1185920 RepID=A0A2T4JK29_9RHOB|nr:signal peptidase I [Phaeovulum veldkampii]MBK5946910.1 signal peptidase I [Phaeovulum veldkampii DSM 11550]NCU19483.1 signal peptidase I [Candidatus Falkowbacteria bacterium]PTE18245.1 signal peptidase I [Phaeovulum veldkampii DSM 11550]TDQ63480.1 signal peptidase I [Phaeovulum veldkampii DSM 11550]
MASKAKEGLTETVKTIVYALLIAGIFRTLFFQPFWIPSGSMKDTLLIGDFLFVNKMAYGYSRHSCPFSMCPITGRILASEPERGDVAVFRHPTRGVDFIKRVIGLPGDTIQMKDGVLHINGAPVQLADAPPFLETKDLQGPQRLMPRCANDPVGRGGQCAKERKIETLPNGASHSILNITDGWVADDTPVFTVPEGQYFFMGDNRDNSEDSRFAAAAGGLGMVPAEFLIGRADRIMFSSAGRSLFFVWTWRPDRFFKAVE